MLTNDIKTLSRKLGADLVGIAPPERWAKAPIEHSPKGIMPTCKSAIVCAVKIPDASIEMGAEKDPRIPGSGSILGYVSGTLEFLAKRVAKHLEDLGYPSIAIPQSVYWNYRPAAGAPRGWMPDLAHFYAAAAAGLGEIGWSNLALTPEFGPRQRFVTILTEAELRPDPLYSGPPLCDKCKLCAKHCPTKSFDKDVDGMLSIEIEDKKYTFPNRNLWRCGIGENFGLDVKLPWEEKVTEKTILDTIDETANNHPEWYFGWKMGICIKSCMVPLRRYFDKSYTTMARRKTDLTVEPKPAILKRIVEETENIGRESLVNAVITLNQDNLTDSGINLASYLPKAQGAVLVCAKIAADMGTNPCTTLASLRISTRIESYGFSSLLMSGLNPEDVAVACGVATRTADGKVITDAFGEKQAWDLIITDAPLPANGVTLPKQLQLKARSKSSLTSLIKSKSISAGADLVGIASAGRVDSLLKSLKATDYLDGDYFSVNVQVNPPKTQAEKIWGTKRLKRDHSNTKVNDDPVSLKYTSDYLKGARSVIVIGVHHSFASVDWAGKGPGKKAGHYASNIHGAATNMGLYNALEIAADLESYGYQVKLTSDLSGISSNTFDSGSSVDLTNNRFAAIAAGLGELGWNGLVLTPEFGARQAFVALITDAPLVEDPLYSGPALCRKCGTCVKECPARAISEDGKYTIEVEGKSFEWKQFDRMRCDWAKHYGLLAEEGTKYMGSQTDIPVPDCITRENLCDAVIELDRIQFHGWQSSIVERCFTECPAHNTQAAQTKS